MRRKYLINVLVYALVICVKLHTYANNPIRIHVDKQMQQEYYLSELSSKIDIVTLSSPDVKHYGVERVYSIDKNHFLLEGSQRPRLYLYNKKRNSTISICDDIYGRNSLLKQRDTICTIGHRFYINGRKLYISDDSKGYYIYNNKGVYIKNEISNLQPIYKYKTKKYIYDIDANNYIGIGLEEITNKRSAFLWELDLLDYRQYIFIANKDGSISEYPLPPIHYEQSFHKFHDVATTENGNILIHIASNDTIYTYNKKSKSIYPSYYFDFGENAIRNINSMTYDDVMEYLRNNISLIGYPNSVLATKDIIYFEYSDCGDNMMGIYNIKKSTLKNGVIINDIYPGRKLRLVGVDSDYLIFIVESKYSKGKQDSSDHWKHLIDSGIITSNIINLNTLVYDKF